MLIGERPSESLKTPLKSEEMVSLSRERSLKIEEKSLYSGEIPSLGNQIPRSPLPQGASWLLGDNTILVSTICMIVVTLRFILS